MTWRPNDTIFKNFRVKEYALSGLFPSSYSPAEFHEWGYDEAATDYEYICTNVCMGTWAIPTRSNYNIAELYLSEFSPSHIPSGQQAEPTQYSSGSCILLYFNPSN